MNIGDYKVIIKAEKFAKIEQQIEQLKKENDNFKSLIKQLKQQNDNLKSLLISKIPPYLNAII